jgi:hypothetical protein
MSRACVQALVVIAGLSDCCRYRLLALSTLPQLPAVFVIADVGYDRRYRLLQLLQLLQLQLFSLMSMRLASALLT